MGTKSLSLIVSVFLLFIAGCDANNKVNSNVVDNKKINTQSVTETQTSQIDNNSVKTQKSVFDSIIGQWKSDSDGAAMTLTADKKKINFVDGKESSTNSYEIDNTCPGVDGYPKAIANEFFLKTQTDCWAIDFTDKDHLELSWVGTHGSEKYTRVVLK